MSLWSLVFKRNYSIALCKRVYRKIHTPRQSVDDPTSIYTDLVGGLQKRTYSLTIFRDTVKLQVHLVYMSLGILIDGDKITFKAILSGVGGRFINKQTTLVKNNVSSSWLGNYLSLEYRRYMLNSFAMIIWQLVYPNTQYVTRRLHDGCRMRDKNTWFHHLLILMLVVLQYRTLCR